MMPNARLWLANKTLTMHNAQARIVRELDHLAQAHFFQGAHSQYSFLVEAALADDALSLVMGLNGTAASELVRRHPTPFAHADFRSRAFDPNGAVRYRQGHALSCCSNHRDDADP